MEVYNLNQVTKLDNGNILFTDDGRMIEVMLGKQISKEKLLDEWKNFFGQSIGRYFNDWYFINNVWQEGEIIYIEAVGEKKHFDSFVEIK